MRRSDWIAGVYEYRLATISALAVSLLLVLLLVAPSWFLPEQTHVATRASRSHTTTYRLPARPARNQANESKPHQLSMPHTAGKHSVSRMQKTTSVKTVLRHSATPAINLHMKVENRLQSGYYVQTGAFKDAIKAKRLASLLQHSGWHIQMISTKDKLHAVLAGPLKTRKKAENAKLKLARQSGIKGFIIFMTPGN